MFIVNIGEYQVYCQAGGLPERLSDYERHVRLVERFGMEWAGADCFCAVGRRDEWPFLVVSQRYSPAVEAGFHPGLLLVPETDRLFVGAGVRLLAYGLTAPARLWQAEADTGFWSWGRYGEVVLMAAELEFAAWDIQGVKLWSRFVEPPWGYSVANQVIRLDVMGEISYLNLSSGREVSSPREP